MVDWSQKKVDQPTATITYIHILRTAQFQILYGLLQCIGLRPFKVLAAFLGADPDMWVQPKPFGEMR